MGKEKDERLQSTTLCVAPVGMQPGAVAAPVLSLGLTEGDEIRLLYTPEVKEAGIVARLELLLAGSLANVRVVSLPVGPGLAETAFSGGFDRIVLVTNGGRAELAQQLADALRRFPQGVLAESQGPFGNYLGLDGVSGHEFEVVRSIGDGRLLELIGLVRKGPSLRSTMGVATLKGVIEVIERYGQLFVALSDEGWTGVWKEPPSDKAMKTAFAKRLAMYRKLLEWQRSQQLLGIELRRLLLEPSAAWPGDGWPALVADRGRRDGLPVVGMKVQGRELTLRLWMEMVEKGTAASIPELPAGQAGRLQANYEVEGRATWAGPPLVVVMGPQPGATLRTIWGHQPREVDILVDDRSPRAVRAARKLADEAKVHCAKLRVSPIDEFDAGAKVHGATHVGCRPGDKSSQLRLYLWGSGHAPEATRCGLEGSRITCTGDVARVPLASWMNIHAPDLVQLKKPAFPTTFTHSDIEFVRELASTVSNPGFMFDNDGGLTGRAGLVDIEKGCVRASRSGAWMGLDQLEKIAPGMRRAFLGGGGWVEFVVAILLARVGAQVQIGPLYGTADQLRRGLWSDELDVVTAVDGNLALWSCKTHGRIEDIVSDADEARAQTDRLLGRMELAVLVVPHLPPEPPPGILKRKGWWRLGDLTAAVDLRLLCDEVRTLKVAVERPRGSRGPREWNPFTSSP